MAVRDNVQRADGDAGGAQTVPSSCGHARNGVEPSEEAAVEPLVQSVAPVPSDMTMIRRHDGKVETPRGEIARKVSPVHVCVNHVSA